MIDRKRAPPSGHCSATLVGELLGMELDGQSERPGAVEHAFHLLHGEGDSLAECVHGVDEAGARGGGQHFFTDQRDIVILSPGILRRQRVGAEKCLLNIDAEALAKSPCRLEHANLRVGIESVSRFDFQRGNAQCNHLSYP